MSRENLPCLPYGRQLVDEDDVAAVTAVLRGAMLTAGPAVPAFEQALAAVLGAQHVVACGSGTAALHLAAICAGLGEGTTAVVPAVTFLATANMVRLAGAEVVFADVDPETGLMGPEHLEAALSRTDGRARAVLPVHLNGQCADPAGVQQVAARHGLVVIEDACHALGTTYGASGSVGDGARHTVGACHHADMACFSFHPVKTIAMGEGGAVSTKDPQLAERMARLRNHGIVRDPAAFLEKGEGLDLRGAANPWHYEMHELGFNYRASDIHCALGLSQLQKLDRFVERRRTLAARYDRLLEPLAPSLRPVARLPSCEPAWHLYVVLIDFAALGIERSALMAGLRDRGIGTQVHYRPLHRQPYYRERYGEQSLPGADAYFSRALSLPLFPAMADADVDRVVESLGRALERTAA